MISKPEIEEIIRSDLNKVINTDIVYQYATYDVSLNEILLKQSLRFAAPVTFNDPFDCNEKLLQIKYDKKIIDETISNLPTKLTRQEIREIKRQLIDPNCQSEIFRKIRDGYKLSCFSEYKDEILMWSHYADKHSGICIGYDFPHKYEDKFILSSVKYLNELKPLEGTIDVYRIILYWLTTKSIRWEHEREIRAITKSKSKNDYEFINFDKKYIKEIIFGCNVTNLKIEDALSKLSNSSLDFDSITIKQMKINEVDFLLTEEIIKPQTKSK